MINYLRVPGKVMAIAVALTMMAPVGLTFTDGNVNLADFPPTVTVNTPGCEDQILNGSIMIYWLATDQEENDTLLDINIQYSTDGGSSWFTIMSGTDNNNPPYSWDTIAAGVLDGVSYKFNITATDNASQSDSNTSYMFSIDNIPDDRWYLQIESMNLGTHLDLDMKPTEPDVQEFLVGISAQGELQVRFFASEYVALDLVDLAGDWTFSINAKVSSSVFDGLLFANVYADDGIIQRLLFTTDYDDENVNPYLDYHEFSWIYSVPPRTLVYMGEQVVVEIMLNVTSDPVSTTYYHYADADIPVLGNVSGDYNMTFASDNQYETIDEVDGGVRPNTVILDEDFSTMYPPDPQGYATFPPGWRVINEGEPGTGQVLKTWRKQVTGSQNPVPPMAYPFAYVRSYNRFMDEQLITPVFDLSFATSVTFEFDQFYDDHPGRDDLARVDVRSDLTNGSWQIILNNTGQSSPNPDHQNINITTWAAGALDVEVRFYYVANDSYDWMVDNVLIKATIVNTSLLEHKWIIDVPAGEEPYEFNLEANRKLNHGDDDFVFAYSTDDVNYIDMVTIDFHGDKTWTYWLPPTLSGTVYIRAQDSNRISDYDISRIEIDQMFISSFSGPRLTIGFDHQSAPSFVEPALTLAPIAYLCIQDAPGGTGTNVTTHTMDTTETLTVWSIGYDAGWNYISDIQVNWTNTLNAQTATTSTVFTLDPAVPGSGIITAIYNATTSDTTGLITVEPFDFPPNVSLLTPAMENQICYGPTSIDWIATDNEDANPTLDIMIDYSPDGGTNWLAIMSGTDNNNPPYAWDTVAAGVPDGVNYKFNVTVTDNANKSDSDTSYMFSIDNIPDDRWYLQVESFNIGGHLDLDMKPSESAVQEISVNVPAPGEISVRTFASEYVAHCDVDLVGDWNFSTFAKVSSSDADGNLYAKVYANDGIAQRLLFTTGYDDETVGSYLTFHQFMWVYTVPQGTWINVGEHVIVELMLHTTAGSNSTTYYHYANADIPVLGNVNGDYNMTFVSDNQHEIIEEIEGSPGAEVTIVDEDFNGTFPPDGWKVVNGGSGSVKWSTDNPRNHTPNPPIFPLFAIADTIRLRQSYDEQLITPTMDLSLATSVTLEFDQWFISTEQIMIDSYVDVRSSMTTGAWETLLHQTNQGSPNPDHHTYDITPFAAGSSDVEIRFFIIGSTRAKWIVDNVLVKAYIVNTSLLEHKWTIDLPAGEEPYEFNVEANRQPSNGDDDFVFAYSTDDVNYIDMVIIDHHQDSTKTYSLPPTLSGTVYIRVEDTNRNSDYDISRIEIDKMFISSVGPPKLTIGFDHQSAPSFIEPALTLGPISYLCIQDAPGGNGNNVTTHIMTTDDTFTVWANGYDAGWNYVSDIQANWTNTLNNQTSTSSTIFTLDPATPGSSIITAFYNATISDTTGLITVTLGLLDHIIIRDSPGGLGNEVGAYSITTDDTLTVWAAGYDADSNYIGDVNCNWSTNGTLDFQSAVSVNTFTFDPSTVGTSGYITAVNGSLVDSTGLITVGVGVLDHITIRHAPGGAGSEVDDVLMILGQILTIYSAGYDADNNYIGDIPCNWTTTGALNLTTATSSPSFTFEPAAAGETGTINATFNGTISDETGIITVSDFGLDYIIIEDGFGNEVTAHTMTTEETFTAWAVGYNLSVGEIGPVYADWTTTGTLDLQTATDVITFTFSPVNPGTGTITADFNSTISDTTGLITVIAPIVTFNIDITLAAGSDDWILISFPSQIEGDPLTIIADAVNEGAGLVTWDVVQWYDPQSAPGTEWKTTATFKPPFLNTFNYVNNTYGFWIHITNYGDGNLTLSGPLANTTDEAYLYIYAGWNLVGYPFPTSQPAVNTFGSSIGIDDMCCYDPGDPYRLRWYDWMGAEIYEPGKGYWVHVAADEILVIQCP